jgi:hypothetical protein
MAANCWEVKRCGREPGGSKTRDLGVCPAATNTKATGLNRGSYGGRACWAIGGTLCGGKVQGSFASKMVSCMECEFYLSVRIEEGQGFHTSGEILRALT